MEVLENAGAPGALELLSYSYITFTGMDHPTFSRWTSVSVDLGDTQILPFSDTLALERSSTYYVPSHDARLVAGSFGAPLYAFSDWVDDPYGGDHLAGVTCVLEEPQQTHRAAEPEWECILSQYVATPPMPSILSFGSSAYGSLLLWTDSSEVIFSSIFSISPVPDETSTYPFSQPTRYSESAMSSDTDLPGILLAWHDGGSPGTIWVRYFDGQWNSWAYPVGQDILPLVARGISVCGGENGFWVAWLCAGAEEPGYVFVPLGDVQGTGDSGGGLSGLSMRCSPNPFSSGLAITVEGLLPGTDLECEVLDLSGRLVAVPFDSQWQPVSRLSWDGRFSDGSICPSGTYLVRVSAGLNAVTSRAVLLH